MRYIEQMKLEGKKKSKRVAAFTKKKKETLLIAALNTTEASWKTFQAILFLNKKILSLH